MNPHLKKWAKSLKAMVLTVFYAAKDPRMSLLPKVFSICIVAYALSPIDLIPDFIPIIGYLDDLIIVPVGLWLALRMIPKYILADARLQATEANMRTLSERYLGAFIVIITWISVLSLILYYLLGR